MTPEFKAAMLRRCAVLHANATATQRIFWTIYAPGGWLAEVAAEDWPWSCCTPEEIREIADAANARFDDRDD